MPPLALPPRPFNSTPAICNETSQASVCGGSLQQQAPASLLFPFQPQPNHPSKTLHGEHRGESFPKNPVTPQTIPESPRARWFGEQTLPFIFPSTNPRRDLFFLNLLCPHTQILAHSGRFYPKRVGSSDLPLSTALFTPPLPPIFLLHIHSSTSSSTSTPLLLPQPLYFSASNHPSSGTRGILLYPIGPGSGN